MLNVELQLVVICLVEDCMKDPFAIGVVCEETY